MHCSRVKGMDGTSSEVIVMSSTAKDNTVERTSLENARLIKLRDDKVVCQLTYRSSSVDMGQISYTNTKQGKTCIASSLIGI